MKKDHEPIYRRKKKARDKERKFGLLRKAILCAQAEGRDANQLHRKLKSRSRRTKGILELCF